VIGSRKAGDSMLCDAGFLDDAAPVKAIANQTGFWRIAA
jgi:hypothetical protein